MKRKLLAVVLMVAMAATMNAQGGDSLYARYLLKTGTKAPDLTDKGGQTVSLEKYKGRCVVLDFWASWCPDCRKDMPAMKELHNMYDMQGVEFVGVSFDNSQEALDNYLEKESIKWPQVSELKKWKETKMSKDYNISWIPTMYLLDTEGKVMLATVEIDKLKAKLEQLAKDKQLVSPELKGQDHVAQFVGGMPVLLKFLSSNLKYPRDAERYGFEGRILVKFMVEEDGLIDDIEVKETTLTDRLALPKYKKFDDVKKQALRESCKLQMEEEAVRVVRKMHKWQPAERRGKPVRMKYTLPISFKLD
jgi:thiol-disulfide isomerase/thioredoxin